MNVREGFVEVEGHRLAYLKVNEHAAHPSQPVVVFLHGVLASVNFWRDAVPPSFREQRAWVALSLPAHHPSTVPADFRPEQVDAAWFNRLLSAALEQLLEGRQAILVGHSTGGFCALNLAAHRARSVAGVVSVAGFHRGRWGGVEGMLLRLAGLGRWARPLFVANLMVARSSDTLQEWFTSWLAHDPRAFRKNPVSQRTLANIRDDVRSHDPHALFSLFNGISRLDVGDRLREIEVPCHVFAGSHDPVISAEQSRRIAAEVPHAKTVWLQDVGHMPFMESTETYDTALERALSEIMQKSDRDATQSRWSVS